MTHLQHHYWYLLAHVIARRTQKLNEDWNGPMVNNDASVIGCSRRNIGQRPRSLELYTIQPKSQSRADQNRFPENAPKPPRCFKPSGGTCNCGKSALTRNSTNRGTTPAAITSSIGGLRSAQQDYRQSPGAGYSLKNKVLGIQNAHSCLRTSLMRETTSYRLKEAS